MSCKMGAGEKVKKSIGEKELAVQEVKKIDYNNVVRSMDEVTRRDLGDGYINIYSKTYGALTVVLDFVDMLKVTREWQGFCIQSTNTKKEGRNPSLYPVAYRYENGKTIVKKIHSILGIEVPEGFVIDHLDGNTFNNRRSNFEVVTRGENTRRARIKKEV